MIKAAGGLPELNQTADEVGEKRIYRTEKAIWARI